MVGKHLRTAQVMLEDVKGDGLLGLAASWLTSAHSSGDVGGWTEDVESDGLLGLAAGWPKLSS